MLDLLTKEQKEAVLEYRAENHTIREAYDWLYLNYSDAHPYRFDSFKKWTRSPEARGECKKIQKVLKEEAGKNLGASENRILAVMEVTMKILSSLRTLEATDKSYAPLNRELRENLKYIAEESGDRMADPVRDAFHGFMSTIEKDNEWKKIAQQVGLIQPTPSN